MKRKLLDRRFENGKKPWSSEEVSYLSEHYGIVAIEDISTHLGRSPNSIKVAVYRCLGGAKKLGRCSPNMMGAHLFWTEQRTREALKEVAKELKILPTSDDLYNTLKKGRFDWPPASYIYRYFQTFPNAWAAAGVGKSRIDKAHAKWTEKEDEYLLDHAGNIKLETIARTLGRSYGSIRGRLRWHNHLRARHNQGYLSAAELAKYFNCSYHRVRRLLLDGSIKGFRSKIRTEWQVDLVDIDDEARSILSLAKITHKQGPVDVGDYEVRHGLCRRQINGKTQRVPVLV